MEGQIRSPEYGEYAGEMDPYEDLISVELRLPVGEYFVGVNATRIRGTSTDSVFVAFGMRYGNIATFGGPERLQPHGKGEYVFYGNRDPGVMEDLTRKANLVSCPHDLVAAAIWLVGIARARLAERAESLP